MGVTMRILYVEDNPLDRELVRDALEKEHGGFEITEASSQHEFEKCLSSNDYDVILSDFNILGFEGLQVIDKVKAEDPDLPVIVVTGTGSEEVAVNAMKRGAADYVIKTPGHIRRLPQIVLNIVKKARLEKEKKAAEKALRESEEKYRLAMDFTNDGLYDWNLETDQIYYSPGWKRMLGYEDDEIKNEFSEWDRLTRPEDVKASWDMLNEVLEGNRDSFKIEFQMRHKDGHWVDILSRSKVIFNEKGKGIRVIGTHVDITERKRAEQVRVNLESQLLQAYKMEAIGTLAGGIAHDFNNLLGIIWGNVELMEEEVPQNNRAFSRLKEVQKACVRAKDMVKQILAFSRQEENELKPVDIQPIVEETMKMLRASIPTTIDVQHDFSTKNAMILGDPTKIHQVMINLGSLADLAVYGDGSTVVFYNSMSY